MDAESIFESQSATLTRRLERMVGSREVAEDLSQEAFLRLWRRGPRDRPESEQRAWLQRTASNLAIDELRRRRRNDRPLFDDEAAAETIAADGADALVVGEALARLDPHHRLLVLLRFQAGLSHDEIGGLLAISAEAARKRVAVARRAFAAAYLGTAPDRHPVVLLETRDDRRPYVEWLEAAGAEVRPVRPGALEPQIALADAVVMGGGVIDLDPAIYGERPRVRLNTPDRARDLRELRTVRAAIEAGLPYVGICKGAQLLNVALGGTLYQDLQHDAATQRSHWQVQHPVVANPGSVARRILGRRAIVASEHHQGVRRMGRGLRGTSRSDDGILESIETTDDRFALGLQWHPEHQESEIAGRRIASALADAALAARRSPEDGR